MVNNPAHIPIYLIVAAVHAKKDGDDSRDIGTQEAQEFLCFLCFLRLIPLLSFYEQPLVEPQLMHL